MPIIRNPFRSRPGTSFTSGNSEGVEQYVSPAEEQTGKQGGSLPLAIKTNGSDSKVPDTNEFKLSEINDSGVYLPPSPQEKQSSFWSRSGMSTRSSSHRSTLNENEPFNISRESFDSYRRSFDISARSPIIDPRTSLDARRARVPTTAPGSAYTSSPSSSHRHSRSTGSTTGPMLPSPKLPAPRAPLPDKYAHPPAPLPEAEPFEDVGLNDDIKPKRRGLFARFGETGKIDERDELPADARRPGSGHHSAVSGFFQRKRGQSGQGAELGSIKDGKVQAPAVGPPASMPTATAPEVKTE